MRGVCILIPAANFGNRRPLVESERFEMRISPELLEATDAWAKAQPDKPPRAAAVKRLIAVALELDEKRARREAKK
jgi:hypothetical protein